MVMLLLLLLMAAFLLLRWALVPQDSWPLLTDRGKMYQDAPSSARLPGCCVSYRRRWLRRRPVLATQVQRERPPALFRAGPHRLSPGKQITQEATSLRASRTFLLPPG